MYGDNFEYVNKFIQNTPVYKKYFFDYLIYLYIDVNLYDKLLEHCNVNNIILEKKYKFGHSDGMFWRFEPILKHYGDICLIRDVDYIPTEEELVLINSFIISNYEFQILRMHYDHRMPIMGGLFAIKSTLYDEFKKGYQKWFKMINFENLKYNDDQLFLANYVYHRVIKKSIIITTNVIFFGEKVTINSKYRDLLIGGDDKHIIIPEKKQYLYFYLPVSILKMLCFKGMNYFRYKRKYVR